MTEKKDITKNPFAEGEVEEVVKNGLTKEEKDELSKYTEVG